MNPWIPRSIIFGFHRRQGRRDVRKRFGIRRHPARYSLDERPTWSRPRRMPADRAFGNGGAAGCRERENSLRYRRCSILNSAMVIPSSPVTHWAYLARPAAGGRMRAIHQGRLGRRITVGADCGCAGARLPKYAPLKVLGSNHSPSRRPCVRCSRNSGRAQRPGEHDVPPWSTTIRSSTGKPRPRA